MLGAQRRQAREKEKQELIRWVDLGCCLNGGGGVRLDLVPLVGVRAGEGG